MVDFGKFINKEKKIDTKNLKTLFESLDRESSHLEPRRIQDEIFSMLTNRRNENNLILKASTGSGKTAIALTYLYSHMKEKREPAVYLCPTVQLAKQVLEESEKIAIPAHLYPRGETYPHPKCISSDAIIVCTYKKLFNAKTAFDRKEIEIRPCAIVLDDAHTGIDEIRKAFTILILKGSNLYEEMLSLFESQCKEYSCLDWIDIERGFPDATFEIPFWIWKGRSSKAQKVLENYSQGNNNKNLLFVWPYLRKNLRWCRCIFGYEGIEISSILPLVENVPAYHKAKNKLFMSATLADDSFLIRELNCSVKAAMEPIKPISDKGTGERMVLSPELISSHLDREKIMKLAYELSKKVNVVVLSSSEKRAKQWEKHNAKVFLKDEVETIVSSLKEKKSANYVVLVQRYDGIDLPDNSSRILILDGMPCGEGITDRNDGNKIFTSGIYRNRLIYRIEQGMGRAVRSYIDYAVVILIGRDLASYVARKEVRSSMSQGTRAQIMLSTDIIEKIDQHNESGSLVDKEKTFLEMVNQSLNRDTSWKNYYKQKMEELLEEDTPIQDNKIKLAEIERKAWDMANSNQTKAGADLIRSNVEVLSLSSEEEGWLLQTAANYLYKSNKTEWLKVQQRAYEKNRQVFCPPIEMVKRPVSSNNIMNDSRIFRWTQKFDDLNGAALDVKNFSTQFNFNSETTNQLEELIKELGTYLGAVSSRPEREPQQGGPDVLWLWKSLAFVIEVKSQKTQAFSKKDSGQLHNSMAWYGKTHPKAPKVIPVFVSNVEEVTSKAVLPEGTRIISFEKIKRILDNLQTLVEEFVGVSPIARTESKLRELLQKHCLDETQIVSSYTSKPTKKF